MNVTYDAKVCIHAGECVKGSPAVFKVEDGELVDIYECNMMLGHHIEDKTEPSGDLPF